MDIGDRYSQLCVLDGEGEAIEQGRIPTTRRALSGRFQSLPRARIVIEASTHSAWIAELLESFGHEVLVANPRRVALIYGADSKSDELDADTLARLGRFDPGLLHPIVHRSRQTRIDQGLLRARAILVHSRTQLINHLRGVVKSHGARLPPCGAAAFATKQRGQIPEELHEALLPIVDMLGAMTEQIRAYERTIEGLCQSRYRETALLRQVCGVGAITALSFVLSIEDPTRFPTSRAVGAYLGLRPRRWQSGAIDVQMHITKAGDAEMRRLLVNVAHYVLGPFGPDCDLRRFGMKLAERGGRAAKKRAVVAVARKLAVLLHRLWITGAPYEPLRQATPALRQAS
jgi:transposase